LPLTRAFEAKEIAKESFAVLASSKQSFARNRSSIAVGMAPLALRPIPQERNALEWFHFRRVRFPTGTDCQALAYQDRSEFATLYGRLCMADLYGRFA
jgi:hypothetical protein